MGRPRTLDVIYQDTLYALFTLRKNPLFAAAAVLTLALGIGGNTAIFTVIRSVLLKPLAYRDPGLLLRLTFHMPKQTDDPGNFSEERRNQLRSAQSCSAVGTSLTATENATLSAGPAEPELTREARVSAGFLETLGVQPAMGRSFF